MYQRSPFMPTTDVVAGPSNPIFSRGTSSFSPEEIEKINQISRGDLSGFNGDPNAALQALALSTLSAQRAITTGTSAFPVRENLEAEAKSIVPRDTPLRNRLPRTTGAGSASKWKLITGYGAGYGAATTLTTATSNNASGNSTALVFTSTAGFRVGDNIAVGSGATLETATITAISGANVTIAANLTNDQRSSAVVKINYQPGGAAATRSFFAETGAPADYGTSYADRTAAYKLMGHLGSVTGFAQAVGATFQNNLVVEKQNAIIGLMLDEENALINGSSSSTAAPWGDGTNALAFDGMLNLITTANGTPANQVQVSVGQLTTAHLDAQLTYLYYQGAQGMYMLMAGQEIKSLAKIATGGSNNYRIMLDPKAASLGTAVTGYLHPITGELIPIIPSRFLTPGTIIFGSDALPDGTPAADVQVLPQTMLPELAPNENVQGYVAQEIAPAAASPQVYPFIVTVYEVLRLKSATVFAKSSGVTPA